jgi:hypothetical protein
MVSELNMPYLFLWCIAREAVRAFRAGQAAPKPDRILCFRRNTRQIVKHLIYASSADPLLVFLTPPCVAPPRRRQLQLIKIERPCAVGNSQSD